MIMINPGSGPVKGARLIEAEKNMKHWLVDCGLKKLDLEIVRVPERDDDGLYAFLVWQETRCHLIEMPGLPLDRVRYMEDSQNPFDYPRLYVDGSSWLWKFSLLNKKDFEEPKE